MAGFEASCPKTQAWILAHVVAILFQFQKFQNMVHDPQFYEPCKQDYLKKNENEATRAKIHASVLEQNFQKPALVIHEQ